MTETWFLVADHQHARVVRRDGAGTFETVPGHVVSMQVPRGHEIDADRPGRSFESVGGMRHAMEPRTGPRQNEELRFLRRVVALLKSASDRGEFDRLVVVAPPRSLGELRRHLPRSVRAKIVGELDRDLTRVPLHQLNAHLPSILTA